MRTREQQLADLRDLQASCTTDHARAMVGEAITELEQRPEPSRTPWDNYREAGYTWDEYIEDKREKRLAAMTAGQRFRRWVWLNQELLWIQAVLWAVISVLWVLAVT